ncbi:MULTISPECIES: hypothetical protein [unclassified Streptomyces]|uniref:hypothetical protein n=1 Tax=unclassified Streptomyces TaxID=2593676 RepID=UPI001319A425|nr:MULTISPECIES: hypothetical protein [unclassified Streptomyces]QHC30775.1 hypothetical protein GR129_20330 [Streptomyces sp. HF10]WKE70309.1 hypothetical protein QHG49_15285 [Streptomyces sp. WP-1]
MDDPIRHPLAYARELHGLSQSGLVASSTKPLAEMARTTGRTGFPDATNRCR